MPKKGRKEGEGLDDLDFADDTALLSHRHQDVQTKTKDLARTAGQIGLKISTKKTKHLMMNGQTEAAVMLNGEEIEDIENFIYLGSKVALPGNASGGLVCFTRRRGLSQ